MIWLVLQIAALLMFALFVAGCGLVGQAVTALWEGERPGRPHPTTVASIAGGRAIVTGVVEPAWAVATSPFGKKPCVWYDAESVIPLKSSIKLFRERNAMPFILGDETGRVLVLGRRARWNAATDKAAERIGVGDVAARVEGIPTAETERLLDNSLQAPPPTIESYSNPTYPHSIIADNSSERCVTVGERVTVVGRVIAATQSVANDKNACPDSGQSLGLMGPYVIGRGRVTTLHVLAGTPENVATRARVHLLLGVAGVFAMVVPVASFVAALVIVR